MIELILAILGLVLGSFAGAQIWRQRARHVEAERIEKQPYDKAEWQRLKPLLARTASADRSECLRCHHTLAWYDLVPLVSWLGTGGKCRYCKNPIGWFEPAMEIGMAALFVGSYLLWPWPLSTPLEVILFVVWLVALVPLAMIFVYDLRWYTVITQTVLIAIVLGILFAGIRIWLSDDRVASAVSLVAAAAILGGLYWLLWKVSRERWVGLGDAQIGLVIALFLGDWQLALVCLFMANLIGTLIVVPLMAKGSLARGAHVPFGPLYVAGFLISFFAGEATIEWYMNQLASGLLLY